MNESLTVLYLSDDEIELILEGLLEAKASLWDTNIPLTQFDHLEDKILSRIKAKGQSGGGTGPY